MHRAINDRSNITVIFQLFSLTVFVCFRVANVNMTKSRGTSTCRPAEMLCYLAATQYKNTTGYNFYLKKGHFYQELIYHIWHYKSVQYSGNAVMGFINTIHYIQKQLQFAV